MKRKEALAQKNERVKRAKAVFRKLQRLFPKTGTLLFHQSPWELMVAVQLSAQCTDKRVNAITPALFEKYKTLDEYLHADPQEFEKMVYACGFFRNKTKNILAAAKMVKLRFHGTVPRTMREMLEIPGVARKTANVVLGNAYGVVEGIAVDTHVKRLSRALGLSDETLPEKIERDLMELFPRKDWFELTYLLIQYGRTYCPARKHTDCPLGHCGLFHETRSVKPASRPLRSSL